MKKFVKPTTQFDTNFKFVTILNVKYRILDENTVIPVDETDRTRTTKFYQFNWDNIPSIEYSKN